MRKFLFLIPTIFFLNISLAQTTYTFNGNGSWSDSANWASKKIPPTILDSGVQILINPSGDGTCLLDTLQFITKGAVLQVETGKKLLFKDNRKLNAGARVFKGQISLPTGSDLQMKDLVIYSYLSYAKPAADSSFKIMISDTSSESILTVTNKSGEVVMLKYFIPSSNDFSISSESTALGMLLLYPLLMPAGVTENNILIQKYKNEPEFSQLVSEIASLNKQGKKLFDSTNENMINLINILVGKEYNGTRQKINGPTLGNTNPVNIVSSVNGTFTVKNSASFSYAGQVYRQGNPLGIPFNIAGTYLSENIVLNLIYQYVIGPEAFMKNRSVDLRALGGSAGEYEVKITSGDNTLNGTSLNSIAVQQIITELTCMILGNVLPDFTNLEKNPCFSSILKQAINITNPSAVIQAIQQDKVIENYVKPIIFEIINGLGKSTYECASDEIIKQLLDYVELVGKIVPEVKYVADLISNPSTMVGCQYLDENFNTSACFKVKALPVTGNVRACKNIPLKMTTVQNDDYYPYLANSIGNKNFTAEALDGVFNSNNSTLIKASTDANGEALLDWVPPSIIKDTKVKISATAGGTEFSSDNFLQTTSQYNFAFDKITGGNQAGVINQVLEKNISFLVVDKDNELLTESIPYEKYTIDSKINGGGSLEFVPDQSGVLASYRWTLGADLGEQSVEITILTKPCDGLSSPHEVLSLTFTATAVDYLSIVTISNPSNYPNPQPIPGDINNTCGGYVICDFTCKSENWDTDLGVPIFTDAEGNTKIVNGALLENITNNWGFSSTSCTNSTAGRALIFYNVTIADGIVTGNVKVLGDFGTCTPDPPYSEQYFTSFKFTLINSTLNADTQTSYNGTYNIASNSLNAHQ